LGDYSILVTWKKPSGQVVTTQTRASKFDPARYPGEITKVTRVGGGKLIPPKVDKEGKVVEPARTEHKVLWKAPPPKTPKPESKPTASSKKLIIPILALKERIRAAQERIKLAQRRAASSKPKPESKPTPPAKVKPYAPIYSEISTAKSTITTGITELKKPGTYYDPARNAIVHDPIKATDPFHILVTTAKIKELEETRSTLSTQKTDVRRMEREGYQVRKTTGGKWEFFKTPEQIEHELVSAKKKQLRKAMTGSPGERLAGLGVWVTTSFLSWEDPLGIKSTVRAIRGNVEGALETKARASIDLDLALKEGAGSYILKVATGPIATVGITYSITSVLGAGIGALKTIAPITAKVLEGGLAVGFGALVVKETYPVVEKDIKTGEYGDLASHLGMLGILIYSGYKGYKTGHAYGYGRAEAYLYGKHTYKPGSPEYIRYRESLKVSRKLEDVISHKADPLDITKNIMRLDEKAAWRTIEFLRAHPKTVVGGSAASYTQIVGARQPRDIDLLIKGGEKAVKTAKQELSPTKTKTGQHMIDIHGKEMYTSGKYHRFGFVSKDPIKIGGSKYLRAGEQLFRKGVAGVSKETQYRWFKDVPDFITHAKSLIESSKMKPFGKGKAAYAEKHLELFLHPEKHPSYGKSDTVFGKVIRSITSKPVEPEIISDMLGGFDYVYPSYVYPSGATGLALGGYRPLTSAKYTLVDTLNLQEIVWLYAPSKTDQNILPYKKEDIDYIPPKEDPIVAFVPPYKKEDIDYTPPVPPKEDLTVDYTLPYKKEDIEYISPIPPKEDLVVVPPYKKENYSSEDYAAFFSPGLPGKPTLKLKEIILKPKEEDVFGFIDPFARRRKHPTKDILKEMEELGLYL